MEKISGEKINSKMPSIGGWLILVCIGVIATPFYIVFQMISGGLGIIDIFINLILLALVFFIWYLLYKRDHRFPKYVIIWLSLNLLLGFLAALATNWQDAFHVLGRPAVAAAVWIPYMIVSKRVKTTFIL